MNPHNHRGDDGVGVRYRYAGESETKQESNWTYFNTMVALRELYKVAYPTNQHPILRRRLQIAHPPQLRGFVNNAA